MQGSLEHFRQLRSMVQANYALLSDVLPTVYQYLPLPVPGSTQGSSPPLSDTVYDGASIALGILLACTLPENLATRRMQSNLTDNWTRIWKWLQFLLAEYVEHPGTAVGAQEQAQMHSMSMQLLLGLSMNSGFLRILWNTPGLVSMLSRIWLLEDGHEWPFSASNALHPLILATDKSFLNVFTATLGASPDVVASLIVKRALRTATRSQIRGMMLRADLQMILYLSYQPHLHQPLIVKNSIPITTQIMSILTSRTLSIAPDDSAITCIHACSSYLLRCFEVDGHCRIASALEGKLLLSMFKSSAFMVVDSLDTTEDLRDDSHLNKVYSTLLRCLVPFLIYRDVLQHGIKTLKTVRNRGLEASMESAVSVEGSFWQAWLTFKDYTEDRERCKVVSADRNGGWRASVPCLNPKVISCSRVRPPSLC